MPRMREEIWFYGYKLPTQKKSALTVEECSVVALYEREDIQQNGFRWWRKETVTSYSVHEEKDSFMAAFWHRTPMFRLDFKFKTLRPSHVRYSSQTPQNGHICQYHDNIILELDALHKFEPALE